MMKFNLVRHFSLTSLIAFSVVGVAVILFENHQGDFFRDVQESEAQSIKTLQSDFVTRAEEVARRDLLSVHENGNVNLTRLFANALWEKDIAPLVVAAQAVDFEHCRQMPTASASSGATVISDAQKACYKSAGQKIRSLRGFDALNRKVFEVMRNSTVFKIKVYDMRGITVYSSELSQVGEDKQTNAGWKGAAKEGRAVSELTHRDKFSAFEGEVVNRDLISSYLPILEPGTGKIVGVFEVYSDVTPFLNQIKTTSLAFKRESGQKQHLLEQQNKEHLQSVERGSWLQILVVAMLLLLLYYVLLSIVKRAQRQIDQQSQETDAAKNRLAHAEKINALGQMVAGVAHQLNTPLAFSQSNVDMIKQVLEKLKTQNLAQVEQALEMLEDVSMGLGKMTELVRNLRSFTRLDHNQRAFVSINKAVASVVYIARAVVSNKSTIIESYAETPTIECNVSQLNHVFLNLIMNAVQAVEGVGGRVKVSTGVYEGCVCVAIKDNGSGIAPEVLPHIFEPYFTTKPAGGVAGTGLGLSIAKDIVEQHGGKITVKTDVGRGSLFIVFLPMKRAPGTAA